jgi:hypothetical protein
MLSVFVAKTLSVLQLCPEKEVYEKNGWRAWGEYHMIPGYT